MPENECLAIQLTNDNTNFLIFTTHNHDVHITGPGFDAQIDWDEIIEWLYENEP